MLNATWLSHVGHVVAVSLSLFFFLFLFLFLFPSLSLSLSVSSTRASHGGVKMNFTFELGGWRCLIHGRCLHFTVLALQDSQCMRYILPLIPPFCTSFRPILIDTCLDSPVLPTLQFTTCNSQLRSCEQDAHNKNRSPSRWVGFPRNLGAFRDYVIFDPREMNTKVTR